MNPLIKKMDRILACFCISLSSFLVVCVVWQVFSRYVLNAPSTITDEISRFLFIWVGLMGAAYTLGQKRHLAIDLLLTNLENQQKKQAIVQLLIGVISIFFTSVLMTYGGGALMFDTLNNGQISPILGIEMGLVYAAIPISGMLMSLYLIRDIIDCVKKFSATPVSQQQPLMAK